ncbi:bifunctional glyoxylate/hydroxypyruvate reductase B, partial [Pseudomonas aeruginosa]
DGLAREPLSPDSPLLRRPNVVAEPMGGVDNLLAGLAVAPRPKG